jgi:hypothetical protein
MMAAGMVGYPKTNYNKRRGDMDICLIVQDSESGTIYDISEMVIGSITWDTEISGQPGKLQFQYIDDINISINEGSSVSFKVNEEGVFLGYVFNRKKTSNKTISLTAYDQIRYLKNNDTYIFKDKTAAQIFEKVCQDFNLRYKVIDSSSYIVPPFPHDNKSLFDIIDFGISKTLIDTAEWYMIRDNFGILEFININSLKTNIYISDNRTALDFDFESSIDSDTYNQIKLIRENKETEKRDVYIIKDSSTIQKWGVLQYFETIDEKANEAQIQQRAEALLKVKNRKTKKLKIPCLGNYKVFAGCGVVIDIENLKKEGIGNKQYFLVSNCSHALENNIHKMILDLQVVI